MAVVKTIAIWLLQVLMTGVMAGAGVRKFTSPAWPRMFRFWGYPEHFYLVIGAIELIAGLGLLIPKTATLSALILMVVMVGASITQMLNGRSGVGELVFCALLGVVAYARWPARLRLPQPASAAR